MAAWAQQGRASPPPEPIDLPRPSLCVVRSSDGAEFPLHRDDFRNITTLDELRYNLLSPLLSIPPEFLILMNEEGAPIARDEAVQHLLLLASSSASPSRILPQGGKEGKDEERSPADSLVARNSGSSGDDRSSSDRQARRIFVFDRDHLDSDPEEVAAALAVSEDMVLGEPPLNPEDPLLSHLSLSEHHLATLHALVDSIHLQIASLALALANLRRVNSNTFSSYALFLESAHPSLARYERLLDGWEGAMDAVGKVAVISGLLSRSGAGGTAGASTVTGHAAAQDKQRFLGDYVSREKMLAVRDGCAKVLADLRLRTEGLQASLDDVTAATEAVQTELDVTNADLSDLEACTHDAQQGHARIEELVHAGSEMTDPELLDECFAELSHADAEHRDRIRFLIERKNAMTRYFLQEMQKISALQSDIASVPAELATVDRDLSTKTDNFKHLARLEGLIPAYVATVAEVVRRREYARQLSEHSGDLASSYRPLAEFERARRTHYRQTHAGKLPWEVRGLAGSTNERVPEMALEVQGQEEGLPEIGADALDQLSAALAKLDESMGSLSRPDDPVRRARQLVKDLTAGIDEIRDDFARLSREPPPPRPPGIDPARLAELEEHARNLEKSNDELSRRLQHERSSWEEEAARLNARATAAEESCSSLQDAADAARQEGERLAALHRAAEAAAREAAERTAEEVRRREVAERDLAAVTAGEAKLKSQWNDLNEAYSVVERELVALRIEHDQRGDLVSTHEANLADAQRAQQDLVLALAEKDKLLRDQRTESDLDYAVLEKEVEELRRLLSAKERDMDASGGELRRLREESAGLQDQVARLERTVETKETELKSALARTDEVQGDAARALVESEKERTQLRLAAYDALDCLQSFWEQVQQLGAEVAAVAAPKIDSTSSLLASSSGGKAPTLPPRSAARDLPADRIAELLAQLAAFDHASLRTGVLEKAEALSQGVRKWIKEAKAYRERAHRAASASVDKIAFRNFTKGDLALFLPTRNSAVPVWAAFNVSFPHHFLSATGVIAEQMKTREWIVARITEMEEKVVDVKEPSTNPYLLADGTKYFLLQVEPWSSKESSRRRRTSTDKTAGERKTSSAPKEARRETAPPTAMSPTSPAGEGAEASSRAALDSDPAQLKGDDYPSEALPPSALAAQPTDFTIPEAEEDEAPAESRSPSPAVEDVRPASAGSRQVAAPSALSRAIASSAPTTPAIDGNDPFATPTEIPFEASAQSYSSSPRERRSALATYDASRVASEALPAFLPSSAKRHQRANLDISVTASGPRYPGGVERSQTHSIARAASNPAATLLSSSPASTSASSVHVVSQPRSVSSASGILSASLHRRRESTSLPVSSSPKAPLPTQATQVAATPWQNAQSTSKPGPDTTPRVSKGWPSGTAPDASANKSVSGGRRASGSILDALKGGRGSTAGQAAAAPSGSAEGEMRKLLGQPQF